MRRLAGGKAKRSHEEVIGNRTSVNDDYRNKRYDDYIAERNRLVEGELQSAYNFDKYLITLASGALVLSVTFLEKIAPQPKCLGELCVSWGALALSLFLVLAALLSSQCAFGRQRDILDNRYSRSLETESDQTTAEYNEPNRWASATLTLTLLSALAFVVGVAVLAHFSVLNLKERSDQNAKTTANCDKCETRTGTLSQASRHAEATPSAEPKAWQPVDFERNALKAEHPESCPRCSATCSTALRITLPPLSSARGTSGVVGDWRWMFGEELLARRRGWILPTTGSGSPHIASNPTRR